MEIKFNYPYISFTTYYLKMSNNERKLSPRREKIFEIIFGAETPSGKWFDIILLVAIVASVVTVMLESIDDLNERFATTFLYLEWIFTILFTIEYGLRLYVVRSPLKYATSFYGIIDLLSILPTYLSFFVVGSQYLLVIRALRLLRIFRIFKLGHYMGESRMIIEAMKASRTKIFVFLYFIVIVVIIVGSMMYFIEGGTNSKFTSIPRSIYWAIVTLTTVGYGDISPTTNIGQFLSAIVMILGYAVIAVPTGIVSAEFASQDNHKKNIHHACINCSKEGHDDDAKFCKFCGEKLTI